MASSISEDVELIASRKNDHLRVALEEPVEVRAMLGWEGIRLVPRALPEIARTEIDTGLAFLGRRLAFPLIVGSMTGGTAEAQEFNRRLARAAARAGVGMALGSQRVMLTRPEAQASFAVREMAPDLPLVIGNIGAVQLNYGVGVDEVERLVGDVGADAFVLHLNAAQEAVQPEGDTDFRGLAEKMRALAGACSRPVGVKEVGQGFSRADVARLGDGFAFIESAGAGGTSWTRIEGLRKPGARGLGELFGDWGVPAVTSLLNCVGSGVPVIASGGLRTGLDAARALAAGATVVAMALPLLKAAAVSEDEAYDAMMRFREELITAMFLVGARNLAALRGVAHVIAPELRPSVWEGEGLHEGRK
jgi:isopentenyl-diphosphate delta-isomerase